MLSKIFITIVLVLSLSIVYSQNYGGVNVGLISFSELEDEMKTFLGGEANFGHFVNDNLALEGVAGYYFKTKSESSSFFGTSISSRVTYGSLLLEGGIKYLLTESNTAPYICGNVGLNNFKTSVTINNNKMSESYTFFGLLPGAGLLINKEGDVMIKIEAKYAIFFSNNEFGSDLTGPYVTVGVCKNF